MRVTICVMGAVPLGETALTLPAGATIADAIQAARSLGLVLPEHEHPCGVWSRLKPRTWVLREGDRVEIYLPLKIDPKDARRAKGRRIRGKIEA